MSALVLVSFLNIPSLYLSSVPGGHFVWRSYFRSVTRSITLHAFYRSFQYFISIDTPYLDPNQASLWKNPSQLQHLEL